MEIRYLQDGVLTQQNINAGDNWESNNTALNTIFSLIDNGDGVVSADELQRLQDLLEKENTNNVYSNDLLRKLSANLATEQGIIQTEQLADDIFNELRNKVGFSLINQKLNQINETNIRQFLMAYDNKLGGKGSIVSNILDSNVDRSTKKNIIERLWELAIADAKKQDVFTSDLERDFSQVIEYQFNNIPNPDAIESLFKQLNLRLISGNGEINPPDGEYGNSYQGQTGDCWLLAVINGMSLNTLGKQYIRDSIKEESNGDVTVTLKGVNKTYRITKEELNGSIELSSGDGDIRALEIAVRRYFRECNGREESQTGSNNGSVNSKAVDNSIDYDIEGDQMTTAYRILLGESGNSYSGTISDEQINEFNNENSIVTVASHIGIETLQIPDSDIKLQSAHAYTVTHSDSEYVYLINPHDSSTEIKVPRKTFIEFFNEVQTVNLC